MRKVLTLFLLLAVANLVFALEIKSAKFGVADKWADVTEQFKKMKANDDLYVGWIDGNRMAGKDPAPGISKKMVVVYLDNDGKEKRAELTERTINGVAANTPVSQEFQLGSAWLGDHGKFLNVTDKMREIIAANQEVKLDFPTLGIDGKDDPVPGKRKLVIIFYSIDGKQFCKQLWERDRFKGNSITGAFDPIPEAKNAKSPFRGMLLDTAVWQWAIPVHGVISSENNLPPIAYLYIPPKTKKVRGIVVGQFNMLEQPILEHPNFRKTLQKLDFAAVWIAPSLFGAEFNFKDAAKSRAVEGLFRDLAKCSGYKELAKAPLVGIGHSAMANFPWELAAWHPERALAGISYDGTFASQAQLLNDQDLKSLEGIPMLTRNGEYSWAANNDNGVKFRNRYPQLAVSMVCDPGSGHFDINDEVIDLIGLFLEKADQARNSENGQLRKVAASSGWLVDRWRGNREPQCKAAPFAQFEGKEGIWAFDEEYAKALEAHQARYRGKKVELVGYRQEGKILEDRRTHAQIHPRFLPEADGLTIKLEPVFLDQVPAGRAERWSGKKAGTPIAHGNDTQNIRLEPICGPVIRLSNGKMAVRFNRFGFTSSRRTGEIYMLAVYPGNDTYRRIVQQSVMMIPHRHDKGIAQRIIFPPIPNQKVGVKSIKLAAQVNTGMPVEYYVEYGPAYIKNNELIFTEIPAGAKFPVEVSVIAYQYGYSGKVQIQSANPVNRKFRIEK